MGCTDGHFRYMMRQISRRTFLYTHMVPSTSIISAVRAELGGAKYTQQRLSAILARVRGGRPQVSATALPDQLPSSYVDHANSHSPGLERVIGYSDVEHPVGLQLGGNSPDELSFCARIAQELGYDEVNLNAGCPSKNVQQGCFGAALMKNPSLVAACVEAMKKSVQIPITVKHRIGVDDKDSYEHLRDFVRIVAASGCDRFIVHARKAWLKGLSPEENRTLPPIMYDYVYRLKEEFPELKFEINGEIKTVEDIRLHMQKGLDGMMIGRAAYANPFLFATIDSEIFGDTNKPPQRSEVVQNMFSYANLKVQEGVKLWDIVKPMLDLFAHLPGGAKNWRKYLAAEVGSVRMKGRTPTVLLEALALTQESYRASLPPSWLFQNPKPSRARAYRGKERK